MLEVIKELQKIKFYTKNGWIPQSKVRVEQVLTKVSQENTVLLSFPVLKSYNRSICSIYTYI